MRWPVLCSLLLVMACVQSTRIAAPGELLQGKAWLYVKRTPDGPQVVVIRDSALYFSDTKQVAYVLSYDVPLEELRLEVSSNDEVIVDPGPDAFALPRPARIFQVQDQAASPIDVLPPEVRDIRVKRRCPSLSAQTYRLPSERWVIKALRSGQGILIATNGEDPREEENWRRLRPQYFDGEQVVELSAMADQLEQEQTLSGDLRLARDLQGRIFLSAGGANVYEIAETEPPTIARTITLTSTTMEIHPAAIAAGQTADGDALFYAINWDHQLIAASARGGVWRSLGFNEARGMPDPGCTDETAMVGVDILDLNVLPSGDVRTAFRSPRLWTYHPRTGTYTSSVVVGALSASCRVAVSDTSVGTMVTTLGYDVAVPRGLVSLFDGANWHSLAEDGEVTGTAQAEWNGFLISGRRDGAMLFIDEHPTVRGEYPLSCRAEQIQAETFRAHVMVPYRDGLMVLGYSTVSRQVHTVNEAYLLRLQ